MRITNLHEEIKAYLTWSPLSLVIREICRLNSFRELLIQFPEEQELKILDVGCGDGKWWQSLNQLRKIDVHGIDINKAEIYKAKRFINASVIDITNKDSISKLSNDYNVIVGNCSLEHIPNINQALKNINSLMQTNGTFILYVPSPHWALRGKSIKLLEKFSPRLSMAYSGMINGFFQHWHLYHHEIWSHLLSNNGFEIVTIKGIGTSKLEYLFRLFLPTAFISFIFKVLTGRYLNFYLTYITPDFVTDAIAKKLVPLIENSLTDSEKTEEIFEYMIISRKKN